MRINKVLAERVSERGERIARNEAHKMHNETWRRRATAKKKPLKMRHSSKRYFFKNDFTLLHLLQPLHPPPSRPTAEASLFGIARCVCLASVGQRCACVPEFKCLWHTSSASVASLSLSLPASLSASALATSSSISVGYRQGIFTSAYCLPSTRKYPCYNKSSKCLHNIYNHYLSVIQHLTMKSGGGPIFVKFALSKSKLNVNNLSEVAVGRYLLSLL